MKLFRILHLSDIHIGNTYMDSEDIAYRIISDIEPEIHIMDTQNLLKSKGRTMVFIEKQAFPEYKAVVFIQCVRYNIDIK